MITKLLNQNFLEQIRQRPGPTLHEKPLNEMRILKNKGFFSLEDKAKIVKEGHEHDKSIRQDNYNLPQEYRFNIVIEGKTGVTSIAELCRRERIDQDLFLSWSREFQQIREQKVFNLRENKDLYFKNKLLIQKKSNDEVFSYLGSYINLTNPNNLILLKSNSLKLDMLKDIKNVVVLERINDIRYINKFFEKVNYKLGNGGIFIGCLETFSSRKERKKINKLPILNNIYFGFEFFIKRILPKLSFTKKPYFNMTKGIDRYLSKAEGLGRLVSCGFKIMDFKTIDGLLYFVVKKEGEPKFDMNPSYGPLYKMNRIGKGGKIIGVYKFRTMHPYSEYLQDFIVNAYGYSKTGKPANDFRIPVWGKIMRKFWLDEIPQILNVIKGDLKLVGVRPVSTRYFQDIPTEMQKIRLNEKPGCIPPYVSLNKDGNVMSVLQAEKHYLEEKIKNPYFTDVKYFFMALYNILINHKRSA